MKQQKRLRDRTEKGKCTNNCERRAGLSTLVNLFHTEHDPSDVIGLDNNTAMLFIRDILSPCTKSPKFTNTHGSITLPPRTSCVLAIRKSRSDAHLFCVFHNRFSTKRETACSLENEEQAIKK